MDIFLAYFEETVIASYPGWALKKNYKYPTNARVVVGGGIVPINSVKCLVKNLIIKYYC